MSYLHYIIDGRRELNQIYRINQIRLPKIAFTAIKL